MRGMFFWQLFLPLAVVYGVRDTEDLVEEQHRLHADQAGDVPGHAERPGAELHQNLSASSFVAAVTASGAAIRIDASRQTTATCEDAGHPADFHMSSSQTVCRSCHSLVTTSGCVWCPGSLSCHEATSGLWSRSPCPGGRAEEVTDAEMCDTTLVAPRWLQKFADAYGSWPPADVTRCMEWALGWPQTADPTLPGKEPAEVGRWSCASVLIREAALHAIGKPLPAGGHFSGAQLATEEQEAVAPSALVETASQGEATQEQHADAQLSEWANDWRSGGWWPEICRVIEVGSEGAPCEVSWYGAKDFSKLWEPDALPGNIPFNMTVARIEKSLKSGQLVPLSPGTSQLDGGMARTLDGRLYLKVGITREEIGNIRRLVEATDNEGEGATALHHHFMSNPDSLMSRLYGVVRIVMPSEAKRFGLFSGNDKVEKFVLFMSDPSFGEAVNIDKPDSAKQTSLYAFKPGEQLGQVELEDEKQHLFGRTGLHFTQEIGENLALQNKQCTNSKIILSRDAEFLAAHRLSEYRVQITIDNADQGCMHGQGEPFCYATDGPDIAIGLFDYTSRRVRSGVAKTYRRKLKEFTDKYCTIKYIPTGSNMTTLIVVFVVLAVVAVGSAVLYVQSGDQKDAEERAAGTLLAGTPQRKDRSSRSRQSPMQEPPQVHIVAQGEPVVRRIQAAPVAMQQGGGLDTRLLGGSPDQGSWGQAQPQQQSPQFSQSPGSPPQWQGPQSPELAWGPQLSIPTRRLQQQQAEAMQSFNDRDQQLQRELHQLRMSWAPDESQQQVLPQRALGFQDVNIHQGRPQQPPQHGWEFQHGQPQQQQQGWEQPQQAWGAGQGAASPASPGRGGAAF